jgi:hypothetical protein
MVKLLARVFWFLNIFVFSQTKLLNKCIKLLHNKLYVKLSINILINFIFVWICLNLV